MRVAIVFLVVIFPVVCVNEHFGRYFNIPIDAGELFSFFAFRNSEGNCCPTDPRITCGLDSTFFFWLRRRGVDLSAVDQVRTWQGLAPRLRRMFYGFRSQKGGWGREKMVAKWEKENASVRVYFNDTGSMNCHFRRELSETRKENSDLKRSLITAQKKCEQLDKLKSEVLCLKRKLIGINYRGRSRLHREGEKGYSERQKHRHKKTFIRDVKNALKIIGIPDCDVVAIEIKNESGKIEKLNVSEGSGTDFITDTDLKLINMVAYIKEKHMVPDRAYHELSMIFKNLPRSYRVKDRMEKLTESLEITNVPGDYFGVQQSIHSTLEHRIKHDLHDCVTDGDRIKIKISGDGTKLGKRCHVLTFGYSVILNSSRQSPVQLLAIIKGPESYETWKNALQDQISALSDLKEIVIDKKTYQIDLFLTGDMKFLNCAMGLDSNNCNFSCVWCVCPANLRHDSSRSWSAFDPDLGCRTVESIVSCSNEKSAAKKKNCSRSPLFCFIPVIHVVPDTLHLLLRVTDRLFLKLIAELRTLDNIAEHVRGVLPVGGNVKKFEKFVKGLGFHFDFFITEDKKLAFTDLPGPQRLLLMRNTDLRDFIPNFEEIEKFQFLWAEFLAIYQLIQGAVSAEDAAYIQERSKEWVRVFCEEVFLKKDATPYFHVLMYHVPEFIRMYGNITPFSQQKFELLNHHLTQLYFRGSNHKFGSAFQQMMRRQHRLMRLEMTQGIERVKNKYRCSNCKLLDHRRPQCPKRRKLTLSLHAD